MVLHLLVGHHIRHFDAGGSRVIVMKFPRSDGAIVCHAAIHLYQSARPEIGPGEFLFPCPDKLHGFLGGFGQVRCLQGRLTGMFATLAGLFVILGIVVQFPPETFGQPMEEDASEDEGAIYGH